MNLVEQMLKNFPDTRNSDIRLILAVWTREGLELSPEQYAKIQKCSNPESIRRTRQKLQENGKYLAQADIKDARMKKEVKVRQGLWEGLETPLPPKKEAYRAP